MGEYPQQPKPLQRVTNTWLLISMRLALGLIVVAYGAGYYLAKRKHIKANRLNLFVFPLMLFGLTTLPGVKWLHLKDAVNLKKDLKNNLSPKQDTLKRVRITNDLEIVRLSRNAYMHVSWITMAPYGRFSDNGLIYINNREAVIMDTPMNDTLSRFLLDWFSRKFPDVKIKAVIVNHFHDDCLGGLSAFHEKGISSYANYLTNESITADSIEKPQHTFTDKHTLQIGNENIESRYFGEAHSKDNIVSWIPAEKILFGGCMVKALGASRGNVADANLQQWSKTIQRVKNAYSNAAIVIPGHGDPGGVDLLDYTIKMFEQDAK